MKKIFAFTLSVISLTSMFGCQSVAPAKPAATIKPSTSQKPISKLPKSDMMCTMQYDPVCAKTINNGIVRYQTYSNACMASISTNLISVTKGACGSVAEK